MTLTVTENLPYGNRRRLPDELQLRLSQWKAFAVAQLRKNMKAKKMRMRNKKKARIRNKVLSLGRRGIRLEPGSRSSR